MFKDLLNAYAETSIMVFGATLTTFALGLPLGILLYITRTPHFFPHRGLASILSMLVNALRSTPFVILMIAIIPFTRLLVGTSIGTAAATVALSVASIPFFARIVDIALGEVPNPLIETGRALGATPAQILYKIILPEAKTNLIHGLTLTTINIVGYSAMAGVIGGGGLGTLAIHYGYHRFDTTVMVVTVAVLIATVQSIQWFGDWAAVRFGHQKTTHTPVVH